MLIKKESTNNSHNDEENININVDNDEYNNFEQQLNDNLDNNLNNNVESNQNILRRGFNIFLQYGLSINELRVLRLVFHLSAFRQSALRREEFDWSPEGIFQREERWLVNQFSNSIENNEQRVDIDNTLNSLQNMINFNYENYYMFLLGLYIGFLFNIFSLFLLLCRFRIKFKFGLVIGMFLSILVLTLIISRK